MDPRRAVTVRGRTAGLLLASVAAVLGLEVARGQQTKIDVLHIGTSGNLTGASKSDKEKGAMDTLKVFIKDETGLDNDIQRQKDWRELTDKLAKGHLHLGVYQGFEFAWAAEGQPALKPLALAVNGEVYPEAYVVVNKNSPAKDFAGLKGQSISIPANGEGFLGLFVRREVKARGMTQDKFFSKVTEPPEVEDAIDDVVDGVMQATIADKVAFEAYRNRKPGRFAKLRMVAKSPRFPPPVIAYYGDHLDKETLQRFQKGLLEAAEKERGQTMLTLFHLTKFEQVPADFDQVLAATRKTYPPSPAK